MAASLSDRAAGLQWFDAAADRVQPLVRQALSRPEVGNLLDGVWFGAPLHPALTDVPIGSWTAALVLDGADAVTGDGALAHAADAALLVGTLAAVPAAVTGLADFRWLRGDVRRVAMVHAVANSVSVMLNVRSLLSRRQGRRGHARVTSLVAYGLSASAAHLGGALSFGFGARVNHDTGPGGPDGFEAVLDDADLVAGQMMRVEAAGAPVLVARTAAGELCAISNTCSHAGGPLADGERDGDTVTCPWHGSRFDLCTGAVRQGPAVYPQRRFAARVRDGRIEVGPDA